MRVQDIIRATKTEIAIDKDWGEGKMPRKRLPLSKAGRRAYAIGSGWRWRFIEFTARGQRFVVRVMVHEAKAKAHAHLARKIGEDCAVLACLEFHPDVTMGWHLHAFCGDVEDAPMGTLVHGAWVKRMPGTRAWHRRQTFFNDGALGGAEGSIWQRMVRFFRVKEKGSLV